MRKLACLLAFVLLTAFAAATTAPLAKATAMAIQMSLADEASGCGGCPGDDGDMPPCDEACVTSLPALPVVVLMLGPAAAADLAAAPAGVVAGWTGPPDPSPPRLFS